MNDGQVQSNVTSIVLLTVMVVTPLAPGPERVVRVIVLGLRTSVTLHWASGPLPTLVTVTVYPWLSSCPMVPAAPVSAIQLTLLSSLARQRTAVPSLVVAVLPSSLA